MLVPFLSPTPAPLRALALRAILLYVPLRLIAAGLARAVDGGVSVSPLAIVVVTTLLGAVDLRRRGETMLWANLGFPSVVTSGVFGAVAFLGEVLLAIARR